MKLATLKDGARDGRLIVVSHDLTQAVKASNIAPTLQAALERWDVVAPELQQLYDRLNAGEATGVFAFDPQAVAAPLPRAYQWCDASAFLNHGSLMEKAFNAPPMPDFETIPLMYQGASDDFLGPHDDVPLPSEEQGIDFEGEFGVIVDEAPMCVTPDAAAPHIKLLVQINDWSLRAFGPREMRTGFGFLHAKPSTSFAPVAVTPDELGAAWRDGRVHLPLTHITVGVGTLFFRRLITAKVAVPRLLSIAWLACGAGLVILIVSNSLTGVTLGALLNGLGCGIMLPTLLTWNMSTLPAARRGLGAGAWTASFFLGNFVNPLTVLSLAAKVGGRAGAVK